ncbi:MAG: NAD-dependent succinate-semialdehyde dehydrogenase [Patescibacteria group bacterium]
MTLRSTNPATGEVFHETVELTQTELSDSLQRANDAFVSWQKTTLQERSALLKKLGALFITNAAELATLATREMGKPISEAIAEVKKCAMVCDYYADMGERILQTELVVTDADKSYVRFDAIGVVLAVMPWNFPYWQVMRFAAPAVMAGNVGVLKHASNVQQCAAAIEALFIEAGFPKGVFQNLPIPASMVERVVQHEAVKAITLTGSEVAGTKVAALASSLVKKSVLELGGSDAFIVLADAPIEETATWAAKARLLNNGQSCIAAKRFIVVDAVYEQFLLAFTTAVKNAVIGDPMLSETTLGPLVNASAVEELTRQVNESVAKGAVLVTGGQPLNQPGNYFPPTILTRVTPGMPAYDEELFGPVASVIRATDAADAVRIANDTRFGLGASIWTKDTAAAEKIAAQINAGAVFINGIVKSDARLPFGGTNASGYGRELSSYGLKEFTNIKTVWIK